MSVRNTARIAFAVAVALAASNAWAQFEYHGYFRAMPSWNSKGGGGVCYQLPGSYFKARLGNECDKYWEVTFAETGKVGNNEWHIEVMPAGQQAADGNSDQSEFLQQAWGGLKIEELKGAQLWGGRRYYRRHDVHAIDWFYWNPAQGHTAVGIDDVDIGFGKMAFTLIRNDQSRDIVRGTYLTPDLRFYGLPINPDGTLELGIDLAIANDQATTITTPGSITVNPDGTTTVTPPTTVSLTHGLGDNRAGASPLITLQHNQDKLFGGSNTLAVQFGMGAFAKASGDGPGMMLAGGSSDDKQFRVIEHLVFNPTPEFSGAIALVYQNISSGSTPTAGVLPGNYFAADLRPAYQFNDWFKFAIDGFYQMISPKSGDSLSLWKVTAAPTFVLGRGYYARPELRLFVTIAGWNDAAATAGKIASGAFGTDKTGVTYGGHFEIWF